MFFLLILLLAKSIYVAQTAAGLDDGTTAGNAHAATWFNTSGNWGVGATKVNVGDTVILSGTITTRLVVQASGSAGNITTILFATGAKLSTAAWTSTGALDVNGKSYITIDGGATGTIGGPNGNSALSNGIIESTDNGVGLGHTVADAKGITAASSGGHVTITGMVIRNLFVRASGTDTTSSSNKGVYIDGYSDVLITNCIFHDMEIATLFEYRSTCSNYEYSYITAYNCNWGGGAGPAEDGSTLSSLLVHDNYFYAWSNWDDTSVSNSYHHNGFFTFGSASQPTSTVTGVRYYNNQVGSGTSGEWGTRASSGLWIQDKVSDVETYNNLVIGGTTYPPDGLIGFNPAAALTSTYRAYNNTLVSTDNTVGTAIWIDSWQSGAGVQTLILENNIMKGMRFAVAVYDNGTFSITSDHNSIYGNDASTPYSYSATGSGVFKTIAQWKAFGFDSDLITTNPSLSATYKLQTGSPAINAGANLSAYFTTDKNGTNRGTTWDIGAYEFLANNVFTGSGSAVFTGSGSVTFS